MKIELTRDHALLFVFLLAAQVLVLWLMFTHTSDLAGVSLPLRAFFFMMAPGAAFLNTVIIMEIIRVMSPNYHP